MHFFLLYGQASNIRQNYECTVSKEILIGGKNSWIIMIICNSNKFPWEQIVKHNKIKISRLKISICSYKRDMGVRAES